MELTEAIKGRRSVRKFKPDPVPKEVLEHVMEMAVWAASGMNRQEWYFIVVQGEKKDELLKICAGAFEDVRPHLEKVFKGKPKIVEATKNFFKTFGGAPVLILAYAGMGGMGRWDTNSTALAVSNLMLAAYEAGLGTTWNDGILRREKEINEFFGITDMQLSCILPIGYPDETPRVPARREGRVQWVGF